MAKPPLSPIVFKNKDGIIEKEMDYFAFLALKVNPILKQYNMSLNFYGWKETKLKYAKLKDGDYQLAWTVMEEMNLWADYFSSCANLVQKFYLDSETKKIEIQSIVSVEADSKKVANGDRLANKDKRVVTARKNRNGLKALYDDLQAKVKFCERCHYQAKSMYEVYVKYTNQEEKKIS